MPPSDFTNRSASSGSMTHPTSFLVLPCSRWKDSPWTNRHERHIQPVRLESLFAQVQFEGDAGRDEIAAPETALTREILELLAGVRAFQQEEPENPPRQEGIPGGEAQL